MFILNRYYRENGTMGHSTQFFDTPIPEDGKLPQEVKNRVYAICDADGNKASIDYALCDVLDENGVVWRTEVIKPLPSVNA